MSKLLLGKKLSQKLLKELKAKINSRNLKLGLAVILVGRKKESQVYVKIKERVALDLKIDFKKYHFPFQTPQNKIIKKIKELNKQNEIQGILVQFPLPSHLNPGQVVKAILPQKDVDGFHPQNLKKIKQKNFFLLPPTIEAILSIFKQYQIKLKSKKIIILSKSKIFTIPLLEVLKQKKAKAEVIYLPFKKNLKRKTQKADILIVILGKPCFIKDYHIKSKAIIIDVGYSICKGKTQGDVDLKSVMKKVKLITPVPGGIGPLTVAHLFKNLYKLASKK